MRAAALSGHAGPEEAERAVRLFAAEVIPPLRRLGGLEAREAPGRV